MKMLNRKGDPAAEVATTDSAPDSEVVARTGFFPVVTGDQVTMHQAGATLAVAKGPFHVSQGGAQTVLSGKGASIHQGGAQTLLANGDVSINQGGALLAAAKSMNVKDSYVGLALGKDIALDRSRIVLDPMSALLAGAAFGVAFGVVSVILRRRKRR